MTDGKKRASSAGRELGRLGARKGGRARARSLSPAERSEIARRAVQARWAKSGRVPDATDRSEATGADRTAHSLFRGPVTLGGTRLETHVLADGRRVLDHEGVVDLFTGSTDPGGLDRALAKLPGYDRQPLALPVVAFRVPGRPGAGRGFEPATVLALAERLLSARAAGPLKKQPTRMAGVAETVVRAAAPRGLDGMVDDATGYGKVRARQSARWAVQASIAEDAGRWAAHFPEEFWTELARLDGGLRPKGRAVAWARYVVLLVADAVDPDVGRELRRPPGASPFRPTLPQWLDRVGPVRLEGRMDAIIAEMRRCADLDEFESRFAKVLQKGPSHTGPPEDDRAGPVGPAVGVPADGR
jgi:hypothetical protein